MKNPILLIGAILLLVIPLQVGLDVFFKIPIVFFAYMLIFGYCYVTQTSLSDLGLSPKQLKKSLPISFIVIVMILLGIALAFFINSEAFKDERYNQSLKDALLYTFLLLPIKTVLIEELIFRGAVLVSLQKKYSFRTSAIVSSLLFGLWHILPSRNIETSLIPDFVGVFEKPILISGIVLATFCAGYILCLLRKRFDSLYVPIFAHWTINGSAIIFAYFAWN